MVEFRLYYVKETGEVLFYTCEKPEGTYIVVDAKTYAECRHDVKVIDGKIKKNNYYTITKLIKSNEGIKCIDDNVAIVVDDNYIGNTCSWVVDTYEYR